jgi:hypothetical protein
VHKGLNKLAKTNVNISNYNAPNKETKLDGSSIGTRLSLNFSFLLKKASF